MSFFSALNELRLEKGIFVKLEIPNVFEKMFSAIKNVVNHFTHTLKKLSIVETIEVQENWTYGIDLEKGIEVLKVEKDRRAVRKTRNALRDLFHE